MNMRFRLEIEGICEAGASEVILPEARIAREPRKGAMPTYGPLIIRRGLTESREWYEWWNDARRAKAAKRSIRVVVLDERGADASEWNFAATPIAYHVSNLNALVHQVLIETLELAVADFTAGTSRATEKPATKRGAARR